MCRASSAISGGSGPKTQGDPEPSVRDHPGLKHVGLPALKISPASTPGSDFNRMQPGGGNCMQPGGGNRVNAGGTNRIKAGGLA